MLHCDEKNEFVYAHHYLDNDVDIDLIETLKQTNKLKVVDVFQKSYYKEPIIKDELRIRVPSWRMKEKIETVSAALVMCLNIGVDPPDTVKSNECSNLECWINQMSVAPPRVALKLISAELQKQYERLKPGISYKKCLDPCREDVGKVCISLRESAKEERILFHYNGHGAPKPTVIGEIWVFNKELTQYIPLSLYEVQIWMGNPSFYVWDCSNAGIIIQNFLQFEQDRENELLQKDDTETETTATTAENNSSNKIPSPSSSATSSSIRDSIHLAACGKNELLPMHADLPMDLFTACLTTPIKTALHWYVSQKNLCKLMPDLTFDLLEKIPGQINDKHTMMGELNWILTAITDTIAWNVLDNDLFQKLFRQDSFVADLFRNFLLAQRIMKSLDCTAVSHPALPSTHDHPLWESWDFALDMCISQLPYILNNTRDFISCDFFIQHMDTFDMWLRCNFNSQTPPEQLPIVLLQVRKQYRSRSLGLLAKFLDRGPWAVSAALSVGIFSYVFKLLTAKSKQLRPLITFIWAKIIAVDKSYQSGLIEYNNGHSSTQYFINVLADTNVDPGHKVYSMFVLSCLVDNYRSGQESAKQNSLIALCTYLLGEKNSRDYRNHLLRQWCCICLGLCWQNYPEARWEGVRNKAHEHLIGLISDPVAEVRAAAVFALGTYIGCALGDEGSQEQTNKLYSEIVNALIKEYDMVYVVRKELIVALFNFVNQFLTKQTSSNKSNSEENIISSQSAIDTANASSQTMLNLNKNMNTNQAKTTSESEYEFITNSTSTPISSSGTLLSSKQQQQQQQENIRKTNSLPSSNTIQSNFISTNNRQIFSLFTKVWNILVDMQNDPYPEVGELAQKVVTYFLNQANNFETLYRTYIMQGNYFFANNTQMNSPIIKISTEFVSWCCKYFLKPLLSTQCDLELEQLPVKHAVDIYSVEFLDQQCKLFYNHKVKHNKTPNEWWHGQQSMEEISQMKHTSLPLHCKFHPYDDLLFVVDEDAMISTYDYLQTKSFKCSFSNGSKSRVTSFKLINCQHEPIFLTGTTTKDCVVRLFKPDLINFQTNKLITAFIAFNENSKESDLIVEWNESNEMLMCAAADTGHIRVWDMTKELYKDYATQQNNSCCISCLSTHENYTVAGFGDGTVKLFDLRKPNGLAHHIRTDSVVTQHKASVLSVKIHEQTNKLITASTAGDFNVFDLRNMLQCVYKSQMPTRIEMATAVECHPYNELIAVANVQPVIKIFDFNGEELTAIKHHDGFLGKRIAPVSCLDWNYYKNDVVFGGKDNCLSVFSCKEK